MMVTAPLSLGRSGYYVVSLLMSSELYLLPDPYFVTVMPLVEEKEED
jgi:hypothetical protein